MVNTVLFSGNMPFWGFRKGTPFYQAYCFDPWNLVVSEGNDLNRILIMRGDELHYPE